MPTSGRKASADDIIAISLSRFVGVWQELPGSRDKALLKAQPFFSNFAKPADVSALTLRLFPEDTCRIIELQNGVDELKFTKVSLQGLESERVIRVNGALPNTPTPTVTEQAEYHPVSVDDLETPLRITSILARGNFTLAAQSDRRVALTTNKESMIMTCDFERRRSRRAHHR
jgi:hypothetical protein